jgi:HAMP domain-containing protein
MGLQKRTTITIIGLLVAAVLVTTFVLTWSAEQSVAASFRDSQFGISIEPPRPGASTTDGSALVRPSSGVTLSTERVQSAIRQRLEISAGLVILGMAIAGVIASTYMARRVLRPVRALTKAAADLEADQLSEDEINALQKIGGTDEVASLTRLFARMAMQVKKREQELRQEVQQLHIEIDRAKAASEVAEITETDSFAQLVQRAGQLRAARQAGGSGTGPSEPKTEG